MFHLKDNEKLKIKARRHWFILFGRIIVILFVFISPFILYALMFNTAKENILTGFFPTAITPALIIFLSALWSLLIWLKLAAVWTDYYLDIWIVTNRRIIDIEQKGFFRREVSTLRTEQIQDITVRVHGIFATILNFGDIHVQSAGESREFIARGIPNPNAVKEMILKQHDKVIET